MPVFSLSYSTVIEEVYSNLTIGYPIFDAPQTVVTFTEFNIYSILDVYNEVVTSSAPAFVDNPVAGQTVSAILDGTREIITLSDRQVENVVAKPPGPPGQQEGPPGLTKWKNVPAAVSTTWKTIQ